MYSQPTPYMFQMVSVPVMGGSATGTMSGQAVYPGGQVDTRLSQMCQPGSFQDVGPVMRGPSRVSSAFTYPSRNVVLVAGQYREVRPTVSQALFAAGGHHFHIEPADLPMGLQLDAVTGTIWGTPSSPPVAMDPAGPYREYTVVLSSPAGQSTCKVGIKVVQFNPQNFSISHISQLDKSKYMVLVDTQGRQGLV
eukprot:TRINITY_DN3307_c0_g4_i1.p1 TRINITY_DN3307_c0_g4~~TRINITY_DN3307_c0_g4_i1.p1  ORF type:complete len:194 (-),score=21.05 TRINITY_DN3307_c0_g4_i1:114-695(-)